MADRNVISLLGERAFREAGQLFDKIHAMAIESLNNCSCINLLELEPDKQLRTIRQFAIFKRNAAMSSKAFGEACWKKREALGSGASDRMQMRSAWASFSQYSSTSRWAPEPIVTIAVQRRDGP